MQKKYANTITIILLFLQEILFIMKTIGILAGFVMSINFAFSQQFQGKQYLIASDKLSQIIWADSSQTEVRIKRLTGYSKKGSDGIIWLDENNKKHFAKANEILQIKAPVSLLGKLVDMRNILENSTQWSDERLKDANKDSVYFGSFTLKKKTKLAQKINPGFDSKIQIYIDYKAKRLLGSKNNYKRYYVSTQDGQSFKLSRSMWGTNNLKRKFSILFGNCNNLMEEHAQKPKWKKLAFYVAENEKCTSLTAERNQILLNESVVETLEKTEAKEELAEKENHGEEESTPSTEEN